ncbi:MULTISPECIES: DUF423 domain-containing protein [unclassified Coleofasciculus]|uniref:DUF423 domain-containing protein n=1 Tax=unclassified Coleofasciculus TaxID=2692782 RepID=UPI0018802AEF|nr:MULTISPECIES: DUF423 domain-containing protein [unclassified Coleofasciculus]MBE9124931.1 DUF423 domain-containing protein [Coleofasciculus sp. LEGE 07081]MBE9147955.1 DUF423 domain-containing protein [Coleofasciculus sp. LEGE 07092]
MARIFLFIAALLGGFAVAGGAFAAHALKAKLSERAIDIFETGTRYQIYHSLALLVVALLLSRAEAAQSMLVTAGLAFIVGIALFSGSLYAMSLTGMKWAGAIAPFGGVAFILGWGCLAIAAWNFK